MVENGFETMRTLGPKRDPLDLDQVAAEPGRG
jgi:hypothetical protein